MLGPSIIQRVLLTGALGALIKKTKKESFKVKIRLFYVFEKLTAQIPMQILTIFDSLTSVPGAPVNISQ